MGLLSEIGQSKNRIIAERLARLNALRAQNNNYEYEGDQPWLINRPVRGEAENFLRQAAIGAGDLVDETIGLGAKKIARALPQGVRQFARDMGSGAINSAVDSYNIITGRDAREDALRAIAFAKNAIPVDTRESMRLADIGSSIPTGLIGRTLFKAGRSGKLGVRKISDLIDPLDPVWGVRGSIKPTTAKMTGNYASAITGSTNPHYYDLVMGQNRARDNIVNWADQVPSNIYDDLISPKKLVDLPEGIITPTGADFSVGNVYKAMANAGGGRARTSKYLKDMGIDAIEKPSKYGRALYALDPEDVAIQGVKQATIPKEIVEAIQKAAKKKLNRDKGIKY